MWRHFDYKAEESNPGTNLETKKPPKRNYAQE
jgi:hypothetical protein